MNVRGNGQLTLPASLRRKAGLSEGDTLAVGLTDDGSIILKPIAVVDRLHGDLLDRLLSEESRISGQDTQSARLTPSDPVQGEGESLQTLFGRLRRREIGRRSFVARATALGMSSSAVADLLASDELDESATIPELLETSPATLPTNEAVETVHICQAFQSLLYLPLYIARDVGFFEEAGVDVEVSSAGGGLESWSTVEVGLAQYSIHDPVFAVRAYERGRDAVVVGSICNGYAILATAKDPSIEHTSDPLEFMKRTLAGRTVATQPEPDSQWAVLNYLGFIYGVKMGDDYRNLQVPIGTETEPVRAGKADIGTAFPPAADLAISKGLHEVFDVSRFFGPFALSSLCTKRSFIREHPQSHHAILLALERACQYAYVYPDEVIKIAQSEFHDENPEVIAKAARRCLERRFVPEHVYVDGEAWRESQTVHKFVGTVKSMHDLAEVIDNEAALRAYRDSRSPRLESSKPRPIHAIDAKRGRKNTGSKSEEIDNSGL